MASQIRSVWTEYVQPMLKRPDRVQFAALCYDVEGPHRKVLLITSRDTGRWIIPKGWPMDGKDSAGAALTEAWEEAGVRVGIPADEPVGSYSYEKGLKGDWSIPVTTMVYPVRVVSLEEDYPEAHQRSRKWVTPQEAATMVDEPELRDILAQF